MIGGLDANTHVGLKPAVKTSDSPEEDPITRIGLEGAEKECAQALEFRHFLWMAGLFAVITFEGRDGSATPWGFGEDEGHRIDYLLGDAQTQKNTKKTWVDHELSVKWQYTEKVRDHFPNRGRFAVQLPRTRARPRAIKWQRQRMLMALDDAEAREPFLKEVSHELEAGN